MYFWLFLALLTLGEVNLSRKVACRRLVDTTTDSKDLGYKVALKLYQRISVILYDVGISSNIRGRMSTALDLPVGGPGFETRRG